MNLRNAKDYSIGLNIGTESVGWAVVDSQGELYKFKGKNTWGSRLFDSASTAEETKTFRALRRRYGRRYRRIHDLQIFIYPDIQAVDPDFFKRLKQSSLWAEDKDFQDVYTFFNDPAYDEKRYYKEYPTIYHLRKHLIESHEKADIRLIYLALHHMMKYRGNFLVQGNVSAKRANSSAAIDAFLDELTYYCDRKEIAFYREDVDVSVLKQALEDPSSIRRVRQEMFSDALQLSLEHKKLAKSFGEAALGYQVNYATLFDVKGNADSKFSLSNIEKSEKFETEIVSGEDLPLFTATKGLHDAYLLAGLLKGSTSLSDSMVLLYEDHKKDLRILKSLVRKYFPNKANESPDNEPGTSIYNRLFRGPSYADGTYRKEKTQGYTAYILGKQSADDFYKELKRLFGTVEFSQEDRAQWNIFEKKMDECSFLRKQRSNQNGAIPHQLHLEEMHVILENQKQYYPSLRENEEHIEALLTFQLPYYVGPLGKENNPERRKPFSWAIRVPGKENEPVHPWNFEQVIDKDASAEAFVRNLTGECSYFLGKGVIPKNSLLFSEFCVRQELNVCKLDSDGEHFSRMDNETVQAIYEDVFMQTKRLTVDKVESYLKQRFGGTHYRIIGTKKESEFASSLGSYHDFKKILGHDITQGDEYQMVETLIAWLTIFEDKELLKRKVKTTYGPCECGGNGALDVQQVKRVCKLHYTGWSNLSKEFLLDLCAEYEGRCVCIMDILRDSDDVRAMTLAEILTDKRFGFQAVLEEKNQAFLEDQNGYVLDGIPGSPAIKRGIHQSLKIIEEIISITKKQPARICVEMAREEVVHSKRSRMKIRTKQLEEWYVSTKEGADEDKEGLKVELKNHKEDLENDRLYLYFLQQGKCMYCGEPFSIEELDDYCIDHIIPQSIIKNDSIDNKVLVHRDCKEAKPDVYPIEESLRIRNAGWWKELANVGLMSKKKNEILTRPTLTSRQVQGFISRQLLETQGISKHVTTLLQAEYPDAVVEAVKAELTFNLRREYGLYGIGEVNDFHHAHEAYLACQLSRFLSLRYPMMAAAMDVKTYTTYTKAIKGSKKASNGLIVDSFDQDGFDSESEGIFRDGWRGKDEIVRLRKCLNYKDCFVSRKIENPTGRFWDQTIYSHRNKSAKAIPLKGGLAPEKYGYYRHPNSAFFSVIEHVDVSKESAKKTISVVGIPINESYNIKTEVDLQAYLETKYVAPRILKAHIGKYQKIEWNGGVYYLTSSSEMINARQLWLPWEFLQLLDASNSTIRFAQLTDKKKRIDSMYEYLLRQVGEAYPRYSRMFKKLIEENRRFIFGQKSTIEKVEALRELLAVLHCNAACGLSSFGLASTAGRMAGLNFGTSIKEIVFIDSSVTGMFEHRYTIER